MSVSNNPDNQVSAKCTECTNVFSRPVQRGKPRLTCSEECRRTRATLQRRNQGKRKDRNARHAPPTRSPIPIFETRQLGTNSESLRGAIARLREADRTIEKTLEETNEEIQELGFEDLSVMRNLIDDCDALRREIKAVLDEYP